MRAFVALWPPPTVTAVLEELPRPPIEGIRYTRLGQWHLTLAFLGTVAEGALGSILMAIEHAIAPLEAFDAALGPTTVVLGRSVLCVPVSGQGLESLAAAVRSAPLPGALDADRPFFGHVTLARASRRRIPRELVGQAVQVKWHVEEVHLVRSTLEPTGSRYESLAVIPLGS